MKGGVAFAAVRFPREVEPGERWAEKTWVATPWIFGNGLFGVQLHDEAVQWLRGWALTLRDEAVKQKAVEKARHTEHCRL